MADVVESVINDLGIRAISFIVDLFFADMKRVTEFLSEIEKRKLVFE